MCPTCKGLGKVTADGVVGDCPACRGTGRERTLTEIVTEDLGKMGRFFVQNEARPIFAIGIRIIGEHQGDVVTVLPPEVDAYALARALRLALDIVRTRIRKAERANQKVDLIDRIDERKN